MTQQQLDRTVARKTGESIHTIRHRGFSIQAGPPQDLEPEDLLLAVDCPFCGQPCHLPAGLSALAECNSCDVDFDYVRVHARIRRR
jgi:hypothetical protein